MASPTQGEAADMALGERIRQLRAERGWSQEELATHVGSDARGISRYENGRITPSLDALLRIAETLNVSLDYLAVDGAPRRPFRVDDPGLAEQLAQAGELTPEDRASLLNILDALLTKTRVKAVITGQAS
jgi:transcriptional regulator with XRE-family HTH domain